MEQLSNALALEETQLGAVMPELDPVAVDFWLRNGKTTKVSYPDVAAAIVDRLVNGNLEELGSGWTRAVWNQVVFHDRREDTPATPVPALAV